MADLCRSPAVRPGIQTVMIAAAWRRWRRAAWVPAMALASAAGVGLPPAQSEGVVVVVLMAGLLAAVVALLCDHEPPPAAVVLSVVCGYGVLGLCTWNVPVGLLLALSVLATTPTARRLLATGGRSGMQGTPLATMSDLAVLGEWTVTGQALRFSDVRPEDAVGIVQRRALVLDELETRGLFHRCV